MDVYGLHREDAVDEESDLKPRDFYGASKIMAELIVKEWAKEHGVTLHILRLAHVYGPKDKRNYSIPVWLQAANKGESIRVFTNPRMYRNCIYIDDCCNMIWRAAFLEEETGIINLVSRHNATMLEIATLCKKISINEKEIEFKNDIDRQDCVGLRFKNNDKAKKYLGEEQFDLYRGLKEEYLRLLSM